MTDPAPANNRATDVDEAVPPQSLAVEIRAGDPAVVGPAAFEVPYSIDVRNTGPNPLTNLQVSDSLSSAFAQGAPTLTMSAGRRCSRVRALHPRRPSGPCVANSGFTGIGSESDPATQLLGGSGSVGVGQGCNFAFRVRLTYRNAAAIPTAAQINRATARTSSRAGGLIVATAEASASVQLRLPRIDVTKMLTGVQQVGDESVFDVGYAFVLRNTSEAPAPNAQLTDDLAATFAPGAPRHHHRVRAVARGRERVAHPGDVVRRRHGEVDPGRVRHDDARHRATHRIDGPRPLRHRQLHPGRGRPEQQCDRDHQRGAGRRPSS